MLCQVLFSICRSELCLICQSTAANTIVLPCRHLCLCNEVRITPHMQCLCRYQNRCSVETCSSSKVANARCADTVSYHTSMFCAPNALAVATNQFLFIAAVQCMLLICEDGVVPQSLEEGVKSLNKGKAVAKSQSQKPEEPGQQRRSFHRRSSSPT